MREHLVRAEPIQPGPSRSIVGDCFLVPGPVRMHSSTLEAMATPAMTARGAEFRAVMTDLNHGLRHAFNLSPGADVPGHGSWTGDDGYRVIVVSGSGTAAMEMAIANRFTSEDRILVPTNGKFGERVAHMVERYAICEHLDFGWGVPFDHEVLREQVATGTYDGLIICHNETSTGITQDAEAIAVMCKEHHVPFLVDGITSVGGLPVHPEAWSVEAVVMGAQKCTAGPSGIAALAVSPAYIDRMVTRSEGGAPGYYLDLPSALKRGGDDQTPWTPAINLALGWATSLNRLIDEGLEHRWDRCARLASGVRQLFLDLGFTLLAPDGHRSSTVTAILYPDGLDDRWRTRLKEVYATQVIGGQDALKGRMFRVGSMGETTIEEMREGCARMLACFRDYGLDLPEVDLTVYFDTLPHA